MKKESLAIFVILAGGLIGLFFLISVVPNDELTIKERAEVFVKDCEAKGFTVCQYYFLGGYDRSELINEVEKKGWKLEDVGGRSAEYLFFRKNGTK